MRAWQVVRGGPPREAFELNPDVPLPEVPEGGVRVRVSHAGVGLPDVFMARGGGAYALQPEMPFTPGQEVCGTVTAAGPGAHAQVGDRVMGVTAFQLKAGGFADECLMVTDFILPYPDEMSDAEAASFPIPAHTAWIGLLKRGKLAKGESLLVLGGSGGTGAAAISLGKALGARVIATASGPERAAFCAEVGADVAIDRRERDIAEAVREATDGRGVDCVFDPVGGEAFTAATRCIAHEGRILAVGFASGSWGEVRTPHLVARNYSVVGVMPSAADGPDIKHEAQRQLMDLWREGRFRIPVHAVVPFERLPDALEMVANGEMLGKVVVEVGGRA